LRALYLSKASNIYRRFALDPFDYGIRHEVKAITNHRMCPKRHKIRTVRAIVDKEDACASMIKKQFRAFKHRRAIENAVALRRAKRAKVMEFSATRIQAAIRRRLAYRLYKMSLQLKNTYTTAATLIQQFVRWRNTTFHHAATRLLKRLQDRRKYAHTTLQIVFTYHLKQYMRRWLAKKAQLLLEKRLEEER
jgi:hypothetical protein